MYTYCEGSALNNPPGCIGGLLLAPKSNGIISVQVRYSMVC